MTTTTHKTNERINQKLEFLIQLQKNILNEGIEDLKENFSQQLEWRAEQMLIASIKLNVYQRAIEKFDLTLKQLKDYTSRSYNVMGTSTCPVKNFRVALEFKTKMELKEQLIDLVEYNS